MVRVGVIVRRGLILAVLAVGLAAVARSLIARRRPAVIDPPQWPPLRPVPPIVTSESE